MSDLNCYCYLCFNQNDNLVVVFGKQNNYAIGIKLKYVLPELMLFVNDVEISLCQQCLKSVKSYYMFKKKCLDTNAKFLQEIKYPKKNNNQNINSTRKKRKNVIYDEDIEPSSKKEKRSLIIKIEPISIKSEPEPEKDYGKFIEDDENINNYRQNNSLLLYSVLSSTSQINTSQNDQQQLQNNIDIKSEIQDTEIDLMETKPNIYSRSDSYKSEISENDTPIISIETSANINNCSSNEINQNHQNVIPIKSEENYDENQDGYLKETGINLIDIENNKDFSHLPTHFPKDEIKSEKPIIHVEVSKNLINVDSNIIPVDHNNENDQQTFLLFDETSKPIKKEPKIDLDLPIIQIDSSNNVTSNIISIVSTSDQFDQQNLPNVESIKKEIKSETAIFETTQNNLNDMSIITINQENIKKEIKIEKPFFEINNFDSSIVIDITNDDDEIIDEPMSVEVSKNLNIVDSILEENQQNLVINENLPIDNVNIDNISKPDQQNQVDNNLQNSSYNENVLVDNFNKVDQNTNKPDQQNQVENLLDQIDKNIPIENINHIDHTTKKPNQLIQILSIENFSNVSHNNKPNQHNQVDINDQIDNVNEIDHNTKKPDQLVQYLSIKNFNNGGQLNNPDQQNQVDLHDQIDNFNSTKKPDQLIQILSIKNFNNVDQINKPNQQKQVLLNQIDKNKPDQLDQVGNLQNLHTLVGNFKHKYHINNPDQHNRIHGNIQKNFKNVDQVVNKPDQQNRVDDEIKNLHVNQIDKNLIINKPDQENVNNLQNFEIGKNISNDNVNQIDQPTNKPNQHNQIHNFQNLQCYQTNKKKLVDNLNNIDQNLNIPYQQNYVNDNLQSSSSFECSDEFISVEDYSKMLQNKSKMLQNESKMLQNKSKISNYSKTDTTNTEISLTKLQQKSVSDIENINQEINNKINNSNIENASNCSNNENKRKLRDRQKYRKKYVVDDDENSENFSDFVPTDTEVISSDSEEENSRNSRTINENSENLSDLVPTDNEVSSNSEEENSNNENKRKLRDRQKYRKKYVDDDDENSKNLSDFVPTDSEVVSSDSEDENSRNKQILPNNNLNNQKIKTSPPFASKINAQFKKIISRENNITNKELILNSNNSTISTTNTNPNFLAEKTNRENSETLILITNNLTISTTNTNPDFLEKIDEQYNKLTTNRDNVETINVELIANNSSNSTINTINTNPQFLATINEQDKKLTTNREIIETTNKQLIPNNLTNLTINTTSTSPQFLSKINERDKKLPTYREFVETTNKQLIENNSSKLTINTTNTKPHFLSKINERDKKLTTNQEIVESTNKQLIPKNSSKLAMTPKITSNILLLNVNKNAQYKKLTNAENDNLILNGNKLSENTTKIIEIDTNEKETLTKLDQKNSVSNIENSNSKIFETKKDTKKTNEDIDNNLQEDITTTSVKNAKHDVPNSSEIENVRKLRDREKYRKKYEEENFDYSSEDFVPSDEEVSSEDVENMSNNLNTSTISQKTDTNFNLASKINKQFKKLTRTENQNNEQISNNNLNSTINKKLSTCGEDSSDVEILKDNNSTIQETEKSSISSKRNHNFLIKKERKSRNFVGAIYECCVCSSEYETEKLALQHYDSHVTTEWNYYVKKISDPDTEIEKNYKCYFCHVSYKYSFLLKYHTRQRHPKYSVIAETKVAKTVPIYTYNFRFQIQNEEPFHVELVIPNEDDKYAYISAYDKIVKRLYEHVYNPDIKANYVKYIKHILRTYKLDTIDEIISITGKTTNEEMKCPVENCTEICPRRVLSFHSMEHKKFCCPICFKRNKHTTLIELHIKSKHIKPRNFKCKYCDKDFQVEIFLLAHERTHLQGQPYGCDICGRRFTLEQSLNAHRVHHDESKKKYQCEYCGKRFLNENLLNKHLISHRPKPPNDCEKCGKKFNTASNLFQHMRTHIGIKKYQCEFCGKKFLFGTHLRQHLATHSDLKEYKCYICSKAFRDKACLRRHILTHSNVRKKKQKKRKIQHESETDEEDDVPLSKYIDNKQKENDNNELEKSQIDQETEENSENCEFSNKEIIQENSEQEKESFNSNKTEQEESEKIKETEKCMSSNLDKDAIQENSEELNEKENLESCNLDMENSEDEIIEEINLILSES